MSPDSTPPRGAPRRNGTEVAANSATRHVLTNKRNALIAGMELSSPTGYAEQERAYLAAAPADADSAPDGW